MMQQSPQTPHADISPSVIATRMNNNAARNIQSGNYRDAIQSLSQALATIRKSVSAGSSSHYPEIEGPKMPIESLVKFLSSEDTDRAEHQLLPRDVSASPEMGRNEFLYIFENPLILEERTELLTFPNQVELICHAIIYNLGLSHHLLASSSSSSQSSHCLSKNTKDEALRRAISFYSHAQRLTQVQDFEFHPIQTLALFNNIGHAHHCLHDDSTAVICFQRLLSAILLLNGHNKLSSTSLTTTTTTTLDQQDSSVDKFMLNIVSLLHLGSCCAAPAA